jgi:uncharacterized protein (DUF433 family)
MRPERRKEGPFRHDVHLQVRGSGAIAGLLQDVSKSGIEVDTGCWIGVGSHVRIEGDGFATEGKVRYCEPQRYGYRIGISLVTDCGGTGGSNRAAKGAREPQAIGRFMVSDPSICNGQPTFRGTRILVADVLQKAAMGMDWNAIAENWGGELSTHAIAEAVRLDELLPYKISEIRGSRYLDFFSRPFGPPAGSINKGVLVDTNAANDLPGEEPWVQRMIRKRRVSAYGPSKDLVDILRSGDTVFYFQRCSGIVGAATITGKAAREFEPDAERYWDVQFLTAIPSIFKPPYNALTVAEIRETLRFNFLWSRILKVPYLDAEQTARLLQAVVEKIGAPSH